GRAARGDEPASHAGDGRGSELVDPLADGGGVVPAVREEGEGPRPTVRPDGDSGERGRIPQRTGLRAHPTDGAGGGPRPDAVLEGAGPSGDRQRGGREEAPL